LAEAEVVGERVVLATGSATANAIVSRRAASFLADTPAGGEDVLGRLDVGERSDAGGGRGATPPFAAADRRPVLGHTVGWRRSET
jgi:hypothetical protein